MRKRPNQDCIDALIDQRDEARVQFLDERVRLLEAKKNNHWLLWTNTLLVCALLAKPLIQWVIQ